MKPIVESSLISRKTDMERIVRLIFSCRDIWDEWKRVLAYITVCAERKASKKSKYEAFSHETQRPFGKCTLHSEFFSLSVAKKGHTATLNHYFLLAPESMLALERNRSRSSLCNILIDFCSLRRRKCRFIIARISFQGFRNREDCRPQLRPAGQLRRSRHDVRVWGADRRQEADGDHQRVTRERQVPARTQAARECGKFPASRPFSSACIRSIRVYRRRNKCLATVACFTRLPARPYTGNRWKHNQWR